MRRALVGMGLLALLAVTSTGAAAQDDYPRSEFVWPLSASAQIDAPQTSAFGPRLHANQALAYDFHRGLDVGTPSGTPVYAIHAAIVHGAGEITGLVSPGVQLKVEADGRPTLYPTYLHLSRVTVAVGDVVAAGDLLGYTGASTSGFEHLHLEIRTGGLLQRHAVNPLRYLPFVDTASHDVQIAVGAAGDDPDRRDVTVSVRAPFEELDIEGVSLVLRTQADLASAPPDDPSIDDLSRFGFGFAALNSAQTPFANGASDISILDNPLVTLDPVGPVEVLLAPARFNGKTPPWDIAAYQFTFFDVPVRAATSGAFQLGAVVSDVAGNTVTSWARFAPVAEECGGQPVTVHLDRGQLPTDGNDVVLGTAGDDAIAAGAGDDIICGGAGNDSIWGQAGNDTIYGDEGNDKVRGGAGADSTYGGPGSDDVSGGTGDDVVRGGAGDDVAVRGGTGDDDVDGGAGNDALVTGNGGSDVVRGGADNDKVTGGPRPDVVDGGAGDDEVKGNKGADTLTGGAGNDALTGGHQPDSIDGGDGVDVCNGGTTGAPAVEGDTATNCETATNIP